MACTPLVSGTAAPTLARGTRTDELRSIGPRFALYMAPRTKFRLSECSRYEPAVSAKKSTHLRPEENLLSQVNLNHAALTRGGTLQNKTAIVVGGVLGPKQVRLVFV